MSDTIKPEATGPTPPELEMAASCPACEGDVSVRFTGRRATGFCRKCGYVTRPFPPRPGARLARGPGHLSPSLPEKPRGKGANRARARPAMPPGVLAEPLEISAQAHSTLQHCAQRIGPPACQRGAEQLPAQRVRRPGDVVRLQLLQLVLVVREAQLRRRLGPHPRQQTEIAREPVPTFHHDSGGHRPELEKCRLHLVVGEERARCRFAPRLRRKEQRRGHGASYHERRGYSLPKTLRMEARIPFGRSAGVDSATFCRRSLSSAHAVFSASGVSCVASMTSCGFASGDSPSTVMCKRHSSSRLKLTR